jgi:hypothetical protein
MVGAVLHVIIQSGGEIQHNRDALSYAAHLGSQ